MKHKEKGEDPIAKFDRLGIEKFTEGKRQIADQFNSQIELFVEDLRGGNPPNSEPLIEFWFSEDLFKERSEFREDLRGVHAIPVVK